MKALEIIAWRQAVALSSALVLKVPRAAGLFSENIHLAKRQLLMSTFYPPSLGFVGWNVLKKKVLCYSLIV